MGLPPLSQKADDMISETGPSEGLVGLGSPARTVRTVLRSSTPWSAHFSR